MEKSDKYFVDDQNPIMDKTRVKTRIEVLKELYSGKKQISEMTKYAKRVEKLEDIKSQIDKSVKKFQALSDAYLVQTSTDKLRNSLYLDEDDSWKNIKGKIREKTSKGATNLSKAVQGNRPIEMFQKFEIAAQGMHFIASEVYMIKFLLLMIGQTIVPQNLTINGAVMYFKDTLLDGLIMEEIDFFAYVSDDISVKTTPVKLLEERLLRHFDDDSAIFTDEQYAVFDNTTCHKAGKYYYYDSVYASIRSVLSPDKMPWLSSESGEYKLLLDLSSYRIGDAQLAVKLGKYQNKKMIVGYDGLIYRGENLGTKQYLPVEIAIGKTGIHANISPEDDLISYYKFVDDKSINMTGTVRYYASPSSLMSRIANHLGSDAVQFPNFSTVDVYRLYSLSLKNGPQYDAWVNLEKEYLDVNLGLRVYSLITKNLKSLEQISKSFIGLKLIPFKRITKLTKILSQLFTLNTMVKELDLKDSTRNFMTQIYSDSFSTRLIQTDVTQLIESIDKVVNLMLYVVDNPNAVLLDDIDKIVVGAVKNFETVFEIALPNHYQMSGEYRIALQKSIKEAIKINLSLAEKRVKDFEHNKKLEEEETRRLESLSEYYKKKAINELEQQVKGERKKLKQVSRYAQDVGVNLPEVSDMQDKLGEVLNFINENDDVEMADASTQGNAPLLGKKKKVNVKLDLWNAYAAKYGFDSGGGDLASRGKELLDSNFDGLFSNDEALIEMHNIHEAYKERFPKKK